MLGRGLKLTTIFTVDFLHFNPAIPSARRLTKFFHSQSKFQMLTQDHHHLPLTLAENMGLGCPEYISDKEKILEAARKGGDEGILKKLDSGLDTILDHVGTVPLFGRPLEEG